MSELTLDSPHKAERFVKKQKSLGNDVRWDNYDIVFFRQADNGMTSKNGAFRDGVWGFENRYPVTEDGDWKIDWRDVRRPKRSRA